MTAGTFLLQIVATIIGLAAGLVFKNYLPSYMTEKGKNQATKEDIKDITNNIESIKQLYAHQTELLRSAQTIDVKRKERYYDKQATALASTYRRLSASMDGVIRLMMPLQAEERQQLSLDSSKAIAHLIKCSNMNQLYFPDELAARISDVVKELQFSHATLAAAADPDSLIKIRDTSIERARRILDDLRSRFRELILEGEPPYEVAAHPPEPRG